jgi:antitoxin component YwqK of YwqJK toxin-antitoxin module
MKLLSPCRVLFTLLPICFLLVAFREPGGPDYNHYGCAYNGKILQNGPPQSQTFTGEIICKKNQAVTLKLNLRNGKRHGQVQEFSDQGKLIADLRYSDGKLHGTQKYWDEDQGIRLGELTYSDGSPNGVQKTYFRSNGKLDTASYTDPNGGPATEIRFDESGQLIDINCGPQSVLPQDKEWCGRNGKASRIKVIRDDKSIDREIGFLNGLKEGAWIQYQNGKPSDTVWYSRGKIVSTRSEGNDEESSVETSTQGKDRVVKEFFPGTKTISETKKFTNDELIQEIEFYQNGKIKRQWDRKGDTATYARFDDRGRKQITGSEKLDPKNRQFVEHGKRIEYTENGEILEDESYQFGNREGLQKYYDRVRKLVTENVYVKTKLAKRTLKKIDGSVLGWEEYFPDGSVKSSKGSLKVE